MRFKFDQIAINSTAKKKPVPEDAAHYIGLEHLIPGTFDIAEWGSEVAPVGEKLLMKKGDVLFGRRRAYQRKVGIAPFDGIFSAHGMVLRPRPEVVDEKYFPFFISSDQFMNEAVRISVGSLSPTINWGTLKNCEFDLPPMDEQKKLAELLWAANDLKESYKKAITATDEMLKAKFREMFGDVVGNEKQWPLMPIKEFATVRIGPFGSLLHAEDYVKGGHLIVNPCHMGDKGFEPDFSQTIDDDKYDQLSSYVLKKGDLVLGRRGEIGRCVLMERDGVVCGTGSLFVRIIRDCDPRYLVRVMKDSHFRVELEKKAIGTTMKNINATIVEELLVPLPPISLQREFVAIADKAESAKANLKKSITAIDQVMKGLING